MVAKEMKPGVHDSLFPWEFDSLYPLEDELELGKASTIVG